MLTDPAVRPKRPRNLAHQLVESIGERIKSGLLKVGDKLPTESEFVAAYGVSRTVVREAISHLQAAGLVETQHGVGTFVREQANEATFRIDPGEMSTVMDVLAVLELRISLETEAAGLAALFMVLVPSGLRGERNAEPELASKTAFATAPLTPST